jgi:hypothetical protein
MHALRDQAMNPCPLGPDDLAKLTPAFTMVGGRAVHDPGGLLGS